jgi:hypothetical protein
LPLSLGPPSSLYEGGVKRNLAFVFPSSSYFVIASSHMACEGGQGALRCSPAAPKTRRLPILARHCGRRPMGCASLQPHGPENNATDEARRLRPPILGGDLPRRSLCVPMILIGTRCAEGVLLSAGHSERASRGGISHLLLGGHDLSRAVSLACQGGFSPCPFLLYVGAVLRDPPASFFFPPPARHSERREESRICSWEGTTSVVPYHSPVRGALAPEAPLSLHTLSSFPRTWRARADRVRFAAALPHLKQGACH